MRIVRIVFLLAGLALLGAIIARTDLPGALALVAQVGWGIALPLFVFLVTFLGDTLCWHITLRTAPLTAVWYGRLWLVRMIGEAFNNTIPAGGVGGEPVKAMLLNRHFGIDYASGTASLFAAKTVTMIALILFLAVGLALMLGEDRLPSELHWGGGLGLAILAIAIIGFFAFQRFGVSSRSMRWFGEKFGAGRLARATVSVAAVDRGFEAFYARDPARFASSLAVAFAVWTISTLEIYAALYLLGHPVSWAEAWIIEAAGQLARAAAFFIPAGLGALDGTILVLCSIFTGSPTAGAAVVLLRRLRDILWIAAGFALGAVLARRRPVEVSPGKTI